MQEKILVFDTSIGYARYFERVYKKKYEVSLVCHYNDFRNIDAFYYDSIIFIINELEELLLFSKINSSYKGIRLFLGVTKKKLATNINELNLKDVYHINTELNKTDIISYINSKLTMELA